MIRRLKKTGLAFSLFSVLCAVCVSVGAYAADGAVNIVINGKAVAFTESSGCPYVDQNNRTMVPLRVTMEATGAAVGWDQGAQTAIVITEHDRIEVPVGADYLYNNNKKLQNDTAAVVKDGRTYLPIRAVLESADYKVEWDGATKTVNAYNFSFDSNSFVPYSTASLSALVKEILAGNVVYINGQYYATPDYVKMMMNTKVNYSGADLNLATYPQSDRSSLADDKIETRAKEWVTEKDLSLKQIWFDIVPRKGFFGGTGVNGRLLLMPSLPDDFKENPVSGVYDGITIKVEAGEILFLQSDLLGHNVLTEAITEYFVANP